MSAPSLVVDSSALVAIFLREKEAEALLQALSQAESAFVSVVSMVETGIVLSWRFGRDASSALDAFCQELRIQPVSATAEHYREAMMAWQRFGKGRSPAKLNFGDCFSYATARLLDLPLLFIGNDFSQTDLPAAAPSL